MTLTEGFVKDAVFIDFGAEILYGSDQCYVSYPCRFPTVGFSLMATNGLCQIADRIRKEMGFVPMHPMDEYTDATCDNDGWYDFCKAGYATIEYTYNKDGSTSEKHYDQDGDLVSE